MRASPGLSMMRLSSLFLLLIQVISPGEARSLHGGRAQNRRQHPQQQQQQQPVVGRGSLDGAESFPLDFTAVEANMDNFVVQIKNLTQSLYACSAQKLEPDMQLHILKNVSVTCTDGSPAGYVSKRVVVSSSHDGTSETRCVCGEYLVKAIKARPGETRRRESARQRQISQLDRLHVDADYNEHLRFPFFFLEEKEVM